MDYSDDILAEARGWAEGGDVEKKNSLLPSLSPASRNSGYHLIYASCLYLSINMLTALILKHKENHISYVCERKFGDY